MRNLLAKSSVRAPSCTLACRMAGGELAEGGMESRTAKVPPLLLPCGRKICIGALPNLPSFWQLLARHLLPHSVRPACQTPCTLAWALAAATSSPQPATYQTRWLTPMLDELLALSPPCCVPQPLMKMGLPPWESSLVPLLDSTSCTCASCPLPKQRKALETNASIQALIRSSPGALLESTAYTYASCLLRDQQPASQMNASTAALLDGSLAELLDSTACTCA
mmetsp:Transcript_20631/g.37794  ORF Transcript_20631/g.37794 Transcript_20631/m.37794 type:complete len:223 (-) Transcript_20631:1608-2276(-)